MKMWISSKIILEERTFSVLRQFLPETSVVQPHNNKRPETLTTLSKEKKQEKKFSHSTSAETWGLNKGKQCWVGHRLLTRVRWQSWILPKTCASGNTHARCEEALHTHPPIHLFWKRAWCKNPLGLFIQDKAGCRHLKPLPCFSVD